jgi:two-component system, OmpR family, KDP operon response regulator KdpE
MNTILIVEDHKVTLSSLCLIFERNGYHCLTAPTAREAIDLFSKKHVDLVLLDYGLPDIDGGTLATELRKIRHVPIVMISGDGQLLGKPAAADVLFAKPTDPTLLIKTVGDLLKRAS